jgi:hypothetical protein
MKAVKIKVGSVSNQPSTIKSLSQKEIDYLDDMISKGFKQDMVIHFMNEYNRCYDYPNLKQMCMLSLQHLGYEHNGYSFTLKSA